MLKTKRDVDRHISEILSKIKNDEERNLRGFTIAKLYARVGDFINAKRYLSGFISNQEQNAPAHKLMGEIQEKVGFLEKAIESYKRSLELDSNQKDLVLKVCELYCVTQVDSERARYWADRADKLYPHHDVVFKLREKIINADGKQNVDELEHLIATELSLRPKDASLRIKLLRLYLDTERIKEAYDHAIEVEQKELYQDNFQWYSFLVEFFQTYIEDNKDCEISCYINILTAYDHLIELILCEFISDADKENQSLVVRNHSVAECAIALYEFDQWFYKAKKQDFKSSMWDAFLTHIEGQIYMYAATLILKRIKKDHYNWKDMSVVAAGYLLASFSCSPVDVQASWFSLANENKKNQYQYWYKVSCFRISQTGHVLLSMSKAESLSWFSKIKQTCMQMGREKLFQSVFTMRDHRKASDSSFLRNTSVFDNFSFKIPSLETLLEYDFVAYLHKINSLHHLIWLCLHLNKFQPNHAWKIFDGLQFTVSDYNNISPGTLCQLDVQAFLYASIFERATWMEHQTKVLGNDSNRYKELPVFICDPLCTPEQAEWWTTAYTLYTNTSKKNLSEKRRILQRGLETVRLINNHGMNVGMVVHIARTFAEQAKSKKAALVNNGGDITEISSIEYQANFYWSRALEMLEILSLNKTIRLPQHCLFHCHLPAPSLDKIKTIREEGQFFMAYRAMELGNYSKALELFSGLKSVFASYYQAIIFRKLADEELDQKPKECITSEMRSQHIILLTKARDFFYETLDKLRGNRKHPLNKSLANEIENIDCRLNRIDPDAALHYGGKDDCESVSVSDFEHDHEPRANEKSHLQSFHHSTPRSVGKHKELPMLPDRLACSPDNEHFPPSPERLDAQIRSLAYSQDAIIHCIMEQNKALLEANKAIVEELRQNKNLVEQLKNQLEILQAQTAANFTHISKMNLLNNVHVANKHSDVIYNNQNYAGDSYEENEDAEDDYVHAYQNFSTHSNLSEEYSYRQIAGLHGTSTVNHEPPSLQNQNIDMYYPSVQCQPPLMPNYYNVTTPLHFSEGQKLPEFNFPPLKQCQSNEANSKSNVISNMGLPTNNLPSFNSSEPLTSSSFSIQNALVSSTVPVNVAFTPLENFKFLDQIIPKVFTEHDNLGLIKKTEINSSQTVNTNITSVGTKSQPHAFQIPLPPAAITTAIPSFLIAAENTVITSTTHPEVTHSTKTIPSVIEKCRLPLARVEDEERVENESDYSGSDFKPIVPLPDEIDVKTGEEDEDILFKDHGKLFRLVDKEWKERGTGVIKILHNKNTDRVRILMRRDQTLKICANHYILPDLKLEPKNNVANAWIWYALDFSDGESRHEQFCIKFKTKEQSASFEKEFQNAKIFSKNKTSESKNLEISSELHTIQVGEIKLDNIELTDVKDQMNDKMQFGGFIFNSIPIIQQPLIISEGKKNSAEKESILKINIEKSNNSEMKDRFSFKIPKADSSSKLEPESESTKEFGSDSAVSFLTFAGLIQENPKAAFQKNPSFTGFAAAGQKVFSESNTANIHNVSIEKDDGEEYEPNVDFKPVVSLPDLVDYKTGEEDETKLFGQRAKLFRFDNETTQWKERGIGELKIMQHKEKNHIRIVMRREQVLKVCANHYMTSNMQLIPMPNSDRAYSWHANDYSEGELKLEKFAVKFKTSDLADQFKKAFEESVNTINKSNIINDSSFKENFPAAIAPSSKKPPLKDLFKIPPGSWECEHCLIRNCENETKCKACNNVKPGIDANSISETSTIAASDKLSFWELFKPAIGSWECKECFVRNEASKSVCVSCQNPKVKQESLETDKSEIGGKITDSAIKLNDPVTNYNKQTGFHFTDLNTTNPNVSSGIIFGSISNNTNVSSATTSGFTITVTTSTSTSTTETSPSTVKSSSDFKFGSPAIFNFTFSGKTLSTISAKAISAKSFNTSQNEDELYIEKEGEGEHIHFEPVIPLPDKIEVKTGEENEHILYCHQAKLFRFANGEWKERGIGNVKILEHKETGRIRLLMRREPVMKLCLNHYISSEIILYSHGEKSWLWHAIDFSDGNEGRHEKFSIRFKNAEIAKEFEDAFLKVQETLKNETSNNDRKSSENVPETQKTLERRSSENVQENQNNLENVPEDSDSDIKIVHEVHCTHEQEIEAAKYKLPKYFYAYELKPPCPGCRGCSDSIPETVNKSDEISIISETESNEQQKLLAENYKLPATFFLYEQKPPCPGCRGCEYDHQENKESDEKSLESSKDSDVAQESFNLQKSTCNVSFADLARQSANATSFLQKTENTKSSGFLGQGSKLFASKTNQTEDDETVPSNDIYFEPVISLPEIIQVRTGEEDEEILFCHRAKLYRFDVETTQWKERGVGEIKILKQKDSNRCRILMRRDQIFKLACNHTLLPTLTLASQGMTAWCWTAVDFAEEKPKTEQFAVKFKDEEAAQKFYSVFQKCQHMLNDDCLSAADENNESKIISEQVSDTSAQENEMIENKSLFDEKLIDKEDDAEKAKECAEFNDSGTHISQNNEIEEVKVNVDVNQENPDQENEETEDENVLFDKRVQFLIKADKVQEGHKKELGDIKVLLDEESKGARIIVITSSEKTLCNHLICMENILSHHKLICEWSATEGTDLKHFQATFSSVQAVNEFKKIFKKGKKLAETAKISDPHLEKLVIKSTKCNKNKKLEKPSTGSQQHQTHRVSSLKEEIKTCSSELLQELRAITKISDDLEKEG